MEKKDITRRDFIVNTGKVIGAGVVVTTIPQFLTSCEKNETVTLPPPPSNFYTLDLTPYPELLSKGGVRKIKIAGKNQGNDIIIIHHQDDSFKVFDTVCPHQGCPVNSPSDSEATIDCPCHPNAYSSVTGDWVAGPYSGLVLKSFEVGYFDATKKTLEIKI